MMAPTENRNDFLFELLALQQDGRRAISAPTNWTTQPPLLEVPTEVDSIIDELQESILVRNGSNDTARWHFFVGSPGNGKSAAMGKLCRWLMSDKRCQVQDERGISIADLESTAIPYAINVYEGDNNFASVQIVQDASVVRNPFSPAMSPADELLETLKQAWEKGISLVVCTNRGVLEKAHRDNHTKREVNSTSWFKVIAAIVSTNAALSGEIAHIREFDAKRTVFQKVRIGFSYLDNRSLLLGRDTFESLMKKAISDAHWERCELCSVHGLCPFKANRNWLADQDARTHLLQLLTRAEVHSGQVIVFREALSIISLILAGCPKDYGTNHPCAWVQAKVTSNDIFALATRRVYMSLFASFCPHGLEAVERLRRQQLDGIHRIQQALGDDHARTRVAIGHVIDHSSPSTDVGVTRLLAENGIIANLDPCREALPVEFFDRWDSDYDAVPTSGSPCLSEIERTCVSIWKELEESLEQAIDHSAAEAHWALRRWSSNFLLHLGSLMEGKSAWARELDDFAKLLSLMAVPAELRSIEERRTIRQLDKQLENLLNAVTTDHTTSAVKISEAVTLAGTWVRDKLKPKTVASDASGSVSLSIEFAGGEQSVFSAPMFLWLTRRLAGKLDPRCFPQELLAGVADARVRAAAKGKYAFENNDIEIIINTGKGELFNLTRIDGDVDITSESNTVP